MSGDLYDAAGISIHNPSMAAISFVTAGLKLTFKPDGSIDVEGGDLNDAAREFCKYVREWWHRSVPRWKPIDDTARDGGLWPVVDAAGSRGLARFHEGQWLFLAHLSDSSIPLVVRAKDPGQHPVMYFDIPDPPNMNGGQDA